MMYAKNLIKVELCFSCLICFLTFENMQTGLINSMELRHEKMNNQFVELANYDNQISIINEKISYSSDIDEMK